MTHDQVVTSLVVGNSGDSYGRIHPEIDRKVSKGIEIKNPKGLPFGFRSQRALCPLRRAVGRVRTTTRGRRTCLPFPHSFLYDIK